MIQGICPVCNSSFHGRSDKKYCSDQCRSTGNNKTRLNSAPLVQKINRQILENRKILRKLCPAGRTIIPRTLLTERGFDFHVFTSVHITPEKELYFICYDVAFTPIISQGTQQAVIFPWTEYRTRWNPWNYVPSLTST